MLFRFETITEGVTVIDTIFFVFQSLIVILIDVLMLAMFVRAILSWFDPMQEWRLSGFLTMITEPVIMPIRILCDKMHWFEGMPVDIPFILSWLVLMFIQFLVQIL